MGDILYCSCQEENQKKLFFYNNSKLQNATDFGNTFPFESHYGFVFNSTILSRMTNSES